MTKSAINCSLGIFTENIINKKNHFLCSDRNQIYCVNQLTNFYLLRSLVVNEIKNSGLFRVSIFSLGSNGERTFLFTEFTGVFYLFTFSILVINFYLFYCLPFFIQT